MLVELSVMEQRYQAVLAVIQDGWRVVEVADRLGASSCPSSASRGLNRDRPQLSPAPLQGTFAADATN